MIFKFKHQMKINREEEVTLLKRYDDSIHKSLMFFYYQILNGKEPTLEQLRQKFGSIFYKDMSVEDILANSTLDQNMNAFNLQGMKALETFYEKESNRKFVPIGVDMDVRVPIAGHYLLSNVHLIREMKYEEKSLVEVVHFTTTTRAADPFSVNHNLDLTTSAYAFRKLFNATENRLVMTYMKSGKEYFSIRKDSEMRKLEAIVGSIGKAIEEERFYPVLNTRCNYCPYKDICDKYKF
jgi:CRISPR/Cas system-associated exonuclease Cas4 (RecB family)